MAYTSILDCGVPNEKYLESVKLKMVYFWVEWNMIKNNELLGKFQPDCFKTERLVCVETDGQTDRRTDGHG